MSVICLARNNGSHAEERLFDWTCGVAGVLDMFDVDEVALGNGVHNPACIVTERGAYSLATYMSRMEKNPSASRQKSTLTQLLDCVAYLHGRSMVCAPHCSQL